MWSVLRLLRPSVQATSTSLYGTPLYATTFTAKRSFGESRPIQEQLSPLKNTSNLSFFHQVGSIPLLGVTLGQLIDAAPNRFGDQMAIIDRAQGLQKTFVDYKRDVDKLATGFLALGLKRGDKIGIWSPNCYEWALTQMAAAKAGLCLVTVNPALQPRELEHYLQKVAMRAMVVGQCFKTQDYYQFMATVVPEIGDSKVNQPIKSTKHPYFDTLITMTEEDLPGAFKFKNVIEAGGKDEQVQLEALKHKIQFDDAVNIQFTSGTTGHPKAATITHFGTINNSVDIANAIGFFEQHHRICANVPLFHCFGCVAVTTVGLVSGTCIVLPSRSFDPAESLKAIEEEKCTAVYGTPTMFVDLLSHPNLSKTDLSSVNRGVMAGSLCPPKLIKNVAEKLNCPGILVGYGSTELSPLISCQHHTNVLSEKLDNVGKVLNHTQVKVVDSKNNFVPFDTPGEVCARGYQVMLGYWEDEERSKEVIERGWYHTGDIGTLSADGTLRIVGRIKDMIIRGGENIYPKEIEDLLLTHPKVCDAHVIGVADERLGEDVCAWIKLNNAEEMADKDMKEFCNGKIAHYKIPRYIRFVDNFPKTASGKVQKYIMKQEMETANRKT